MSHKYKGIILAGGSGSRLFPITQGVSKQLLPIYDKPMIYYPLHSLMLADIKDILIITTPFDSPSFKNLLGDGSQLGINISYALQPSPDGLAQAFLIGEEFIGKEKVALILGDNIFYGQSFASLLKQVMSYKTGATIFGFPVPDPERFGVVEIDKNSNIISLVEKPKNPKSNFAITGIYFYDNQVIEFAKNLKPSQRNELEITDIHQAYLKQGLLNLEILPENFTWLDTGTFASLSQASLFVKEKLEVENISIGNIEELAFKKGWISENNFFQLISKYKKTEYGHYLRALLN